MVVLGLNAGRRCITQTGGEGNFVLNLLQKILLKRNKLVD